MLSLPAPKTVAGERIMPFLEREGAVRNKDMEIARLRTDRTIAVEHFTIRIDFRPEPDRTAVAAAAQYHSTVTDFARLRG